MNNISAMEFKRYDSSSYQAARDASAAGRPDPTLEETVNGILKFMHRKGIISVVPRETTAGLVEERGDVAEALQLDCSGALTTTAS